MDSLNTSLLLAVQRLAKIAEESSKELPQEGKDDGVNQSDSGRYVMFTNLENTARLLLSRVPEAQRKKNLCKEIVTDGQTLIISSLSSQDKMPI